MSIAVVGSGAMGSLFGGKLSEVTDVWLLDPWEEHVAAMQERGLILETPAGEKLSIRVQATTDLSDVPPSDLALIFVKSHQTRTAAEQAAQLLKADGLALTLQNGLGNVKTISEVLGSERTIAGVTAQGANLAGPGHVRHAGQGPTHLASQPATAERVSTIAQTFNEAGFTTHVAGEVESLIWGKLVINVGINALTALLRVPNGTLAEVGEARALMQDAVAEALAVAEAKGITLSYDNPQARVRKIAEATGPNRSSMLQDILRGANTEIEVINGAVVREGTRLGVGTPVNDLLTRLIKALQATVDVRV